MDKNSNNIRQFFANITKYEHKIVAAGGTIDDKNRMVVMANGFENNPTWKQHVKNIK